MAKVLGIADTYGSSSGSESDGESAAAAAMHYKKQLQQKQTLQVAPEVAEAIGSGLGDGVLVAVDPHARSLTYNAPLAATAPAALGPHNPFKTAHQQALRNMHSGFTEKADLNDHHFESQRRTFEVLRYTVDPATLAVMGDIEKAKEHAGALLNETTQGKDEKKRKREEFGDPADIEGYRGPWRKTLIEDVFNVDPAEVEDLERRRAEYLEKKAALKSGMAASKPDVTMEERSTLHIKDSVDYQGRSFMSPPTDVGTNLRSDVPPACCFLPKGLLHSWNAHTKGTSCIRWFPGSAHLLLSCGMDGKIKLWEVYHGRRLIRTYLGHSKAVRDVSFNNDGSRFLSCSYDKLVKLWDTETGKCLGKFDGHSIPYCARFNPEPSKQHLFLAGQQNKKIVQWDINTGTIVQEYDRHMGPINSITFYDDNHKFCSTSDDKSIRSWEWDTPVEVKYIADPSMHSMPAVTIHPSKRKMVMQSMDNQIYVYDVGPNRFRMDTKKRFGGHMVTGYACVPDFSPDGHFLISGEADGNLVIWDFKTTKRLVKMKAHDAVLIQALWHPHETSLVATAGWDGMIKLWS